MTMNEPLTDAMLEYIQEIEYEAWEAMMNDESNYELSNDHD